MAVVVRMVAAVGRCTLAEHSNSIAEATYMSVPGMSIQMGTEDSMECDGASGSGNTP